MFNKFKPDFTFDTYRDVTPEFLKGQGIDAVLSDIDNTLAPYEQAEPDENIIAWVNSLRENGIGLAFISNNHADRVELFNRTLGLPAYPDAGKPGSKYMKIALEALGSEPRRAAMLGDQLFTDAYAGKRMGMRALIVPPINDKKTLFFRFKRALEKPIMKSYLRDKAKRDNK